jgi:hypothetical protein
MAAEQTARWPRLQLPSSADAVTIWLVSYLLVGSCELVQTFDICELEFHGTRLSHEDRNDRAGFVARAVATVAIRHGHEVMVSNTRGPDNALQPCRNTWLQGRLAEGRGAVRDIVLVAIPLKNYQSIPVEPLQGKIVLDTSAEVKSTKASVNLLPDEPNEA